MSGYAFDDDAEELPEDFVAAVRTVAREMLEGNAGKFDKYRDDPISFFVEVLGVTPWESEDPKQHGQADLIRAVGECDRVACKSGHKIGKSITAVGLALWWVCTRKNARVLLTAPTFPQVKMILWKEMRNLWRERGLERVIGAELPLDPSTGLQLPDGNEIVGVSTKTKENLAGFSGAELLFIIDEASGYPDDLWEVLARGNSAGGAKIFVISNPTRTSGWFFMLFRKRLSGWRLFTISSENTPNVRAGKRLIPGLATREYIEEMREVCGPDWETDPVYMVRTRGEFPAQGTDAVIPLSAIERAVARWKRLPRHTADELTLGVDVARYGGDLSVIQPVRGLYAYEPTELSKADGPNVADEVIATAKRWRANRERVRVNVDGIGVGASVVDALKRSDEVQAGWLYVVDLNVGEAPDDWDTEHERLRDTLWFGCKAWLVEGGAIPDHEQLTSELLAATYSFTLRNRKRVEAKDKMRATLGRSPDYADALCLAVYTGKRGAWTDLSYEAAPDPRHPAEPKRDDWSRDRYAADDDDDDDGGSRGRFL